VLGWASSPEPTRLNPFKPNQSLAHARASSGLRSGLRFLKPKSWAKAQASSYIHSEFSYFSEVLFLGSVWSWEIFHPKQSQKAASQLWHHINMLQLMKQGIALDLSTVVSTSNSCSISPGKWTADETLLTSKSSSGSEASEISDALEISSVDKVPVQRPKQGMFISLSPKYQACWNRLKERHWKRAQYYSKLTIWKGD